MHLGVKEGWVQKKPTSSSGKSWGESRPQKRYLESRGLVIKYYAEAPQRRASGSRPRGLFDLRDVTISDVTNSDMEAVQKAKLEHR